MAQAPFDVYANQLALKGNGYALWRPDPRDKPAVQIADIGYVEKGKFIRLFNASKVPGDESNYLGVPENYNPLEIGEIEEDTISAAFPIMSDNVIHLGAQLEVAALGAGGGFSFMCSNEQGSVLVLGSDADVQDALHKRAFLQYIRNNYKSWLAFANHKHDRLISVNDLVLVTGCDKTSAWACATFSGNSKQISLKVLAGQTGILQGGVNIWASWDKCQFVQAHSGPRTSPRSVKTSQPSNGAQLASIEEITHGENRFMQLYMLLALTLPRFWYLALNLFLSIREYVSGKETAADPFLLVRSEVNTRQTDAGGMGCIERKPEQNGLVTPLESDCRVEDGILPRNQCIFVRGFKILDKMTWRQKLGLKKPDYNGFDLFKRKGGSDEDGPGPGPSTPRDPPFGHGGNTSGSGETKYSGSSSSRISRGRHIDLSYTTSTNIAASRIFDDDITEDMDLYMQLNLDKFEQDPSPMDIILDYILENSVAELALVHDDDLACLIKDVENMDNFHVWLHETAPKIYIVDQVGMLETSYQISISVFEVFESPASISSPITSHCGIFTSSLSTNAVQSSDGPSDGSYISGPNHDSSKMSSHGIVQGSRDASRLSPHGTDAKNIKAVSIDVVPPRGKRHNTPHLLSTPSDHEADAGPPLLPPIDEGHSEILEDLSRYIQQKFADTTDILLCRVNKSCTFKEPTLSGPLPTSMKVSASESPFPPLHEVRRFEGPGITSCSISPTSSVGPTPPLQEPVYIKFRKDGTVEAANLPGLVERLTLDSKDFRMDIQFQETFLMSYQAFTNAETVFDLLLERFEAVSFPPHTAEQRTSVRYTIITFLSLWLRGHCVKVTDETLLFRMRDFALSCQQPTTAPTLRNLASRLTELIHDSVISVAGSLPPFTPTHASSGVSSATRPPGLTPEALAIALTVLESNRFQKIIPSDLIKLLKDPHDSNGASSFMAENNKLSYWVQKNILKHDELSQRLANLKYFLCVAEECQKLRNFSSTWALFAGLASPSITNLKRTSKPDKESTALFQKIAKLVSQDNNYQAYRKALYASEAPCVPSLRVHLHDLKAIHDVQSTFIKQDICSDFCVINFDLYQRLCGRIRQLLQYQDSPPKPPISSGHLEIWEIIENQLRSLVIDEALHTWLGRLADRRAKEELASLTARWDALKATGFNFR